MGGLFCQFFDNFVYSLTITFVFFVNFGKVLLGSLYDKVIFLTPFNVAVMFDTVFSYQPSAPYL